MRRVWLIALFAAVVSPGSAAGGDASANFLVKLFMDVCIPDVGAPQKVRAWAEEHHLQEVTNPIALDLFVGPGGKSDRLGSTVDCRYLCIVHPRKNRGVRSLGTRG